MVGQVITVGMDLAPARQSRTTWKESWVLVWKCRPRQTLAVWMALGLVRLCKGRTYDAEPLKPGHK